MSIVGFLVALLMLAVILIVAKYVIALLPDPDIQKVAWIIVVIFALLWLLGNLTGYVSLPIGRRVL